MKSRKFTIVLLLLVLAVFVGCNYSLPMQEETNGATSLTVKRIDKQSGFDLAGAISGSGSQAVVFAAGDRVNVIVETGDGIAAEALSLNGSLKEALLSEKGREMTAQRAERNLEAREAVKALGIDVELGVDYTLLVNGFEATIDFGDIERIEALGEVKAVHIMEEFEAPEFTVASVSELFGSTGIFTNETGYNGRGQIVAVIDTGIDYDHSAFAAIPEYQVLTLEALEDVFYYTNAYKLSGASAEDVYISGKLPFAFDYADNDTDAKPSDNAGANLSSAPHGTHVAGIIAGNDDKIQGAASEAQLAIMKAFSDRNTTTSFSHIMSSLEDCLILGVDMANLSLGTTCGFSTARGEDSEFMNRIIELADRCGLAIFCASGNFNISNHDTDYNSLVLNENPDNGVVGAPASYYSTISVGSVNSAKRLVAKVNGNDIITLYYSVDENGAAYSFLDLLGGESERTLEYVVVPGYGFEADYEGIDVKGKIAVVTRGEMSFNDKQIIASEQGAVACIILNTEEEASRAQIADLRIPTAMVALGDANKLRNAEVKSFYISKNSDMYVRSDFSSAGALPDGTIGIDILGVGGSIYSAALHSYAEANGLSEDYVTMSGTSMASPNVTGVAAALNSYLSEKYPYMTNAQKRNTLYALLMSTAEIVRDDNGNPLTPRYQGAGLASLSAAMESSAYLEVVGSLQPKLNLGSDVNRDGVYTLRFNIVNLGDEQLSYRASTEIFSESTSRGYILGKAYMFDDADVVVYVDNERVEDGIIVVEASSKASVKVVITLTDEDKAYMDKYFVNGIYAEGFVSLASLDEKSDLSLPFMAFYGDWYSESINIFDGFIDTPEQLDMTGPVYSESSKIGNVTFEAYYNYCAFPYTVASGYTKPENGEVYLGIGKEFGISAIFMTLLRNVTDCGLYFEDAVTGEVILWGEFGSIQKAYSYYGQAPVNQKLTFTGDELINAENYDLANNQRINIRFYGTFEEKATQTVIWHFFVDYEAPTLLKAQTSINEGRTTLDFSAYDNGTVIAAKLYTEKDGKLVDLLDNGAIPLVDYSTAGTDNKYSIDITDYLDLIEDGKLIVELSDSARNTSAFTMNLNGDDTDVSVIDEVNDYEAYSNDSVQVLVYSSDRSPVGVSAYDPEKPEFEMNGTTLISYNGKGGDVVIPEDLGIEKIGSQAFYCNDTITSVVIPEGCATIDTSAFERCYNMTKVVLSSTVNRFGTSCFSGCVKLADINLADANINNYGKYAFAGNKAITEITVPATKDGRKLTMSGAFYMCMALEEVVVEADINQASGEFCMCPSLKKVTFKGSCTKLYNGVFTYCDRLEQIDFYGTLGEIGGFTQTRLPVPGPPQYRYSAQFTAHSLKSLKTINFYGNVTKITGLAFNSCPELENVTFYGTIPEKHLYTFGNCPKLKGGFKLGEGNTAYVLDEETGVIYNSDYTKMYTPNSWEINGEFTLKETVTELTSRMFADSEKVVEKLEYSFSVDDQGNLSYKAVASQGTNTEGRTGFTKIHLHEGITAIPEECFSNNVNLTLDLSNIKSFANYCLRNTGFTSIVLGDNVETINYAPWIECAKLTELSVSDKTEVTGYYYWYSGTGFTMIEIPSYIDVASANYLIDGAKKVKTIVLPEGTETIPYYFARNCVSLEEVRNTESVKDILSSAFSACTSLKTIDLPALETLSAAFMDCTALEYCNYGDNVKSMSSSFENCVSLKRVYIPAGLASLNINSVFKNCTGIEEYVVAEGNPTYSSDEFGALYNADKTALVKYPAASKNTFFRLPETVTVLANSIFMNAEHLEKVEMPSITSVAHQAFKNSGLKELIIGDVTEVGVEAFYGTKLSAFDFSSVESLYSDSFRGTKLVEVNLSDKLSYISSSVFADCVDLRKVTIARNTVEFNFSSVFAGCMNIDEVIVEDGNEAFSTHNGLLMNADATIVYYGFTNDKEVVIPEGVIAIGATAFANKTGVESVVMPSTLLEVGDKAFFGCESLKEITFLGLEAPKFLGYSEEGRTLTYANFVSHIEDGRTNITVYCKTLNGTYDNYLMRTYFKELLLIEA